MQRASLKQNIIALYALQGANYLIPLVTLPFLVRSLGLESYGLLSFAYALTFFMVLFIDAGFNLSASRDLAAIQNPNENHVAVRLIFWRTQIIKLILALLCLTALILALHLLPKLGAHWPVYLASFLTVLGSLAFPVWVFQGLEQMRYTTALFLGGRLLSAVAIIQWIRSPDDLLLAAVLQSGATLMSGILSWPFLLNHFRLHWIWPGRRAIWQHFTQGRSYFLSDFFSNALSNSAVFVIGLFHSKDIVGAFSAIEKLSRAIASGLGPFQKALFPRVAAGYANSLDSGWQFSKKLAITLALIASLGGLLVLLLAEWILHLVFGAAIVPYAQALRWFAIWLVFFIVNSALGEYFLVSRGLTKMLSRCQLLASFVLLLGLPLSAYLSRPDLVPNHIAIVMMLSQVLYCLALILCIKRTRHQAPTH